MFKNLKLKIKFVIIMAFITVILSVFGFLIHQNTIEKNELNEHVMWHIDMPKYALGMQMYFHDTTFFLEQIANHTGDSEVIKKNKEQYRKAMEGFHKYQEGFMRTVNAHNAKWSLSPKVLMQDPEHHGKHDENKAIIAQITKDHRHFMDLAKRFLGFIDRQENKKATALFDGEILPIILEINQKMDYFMELQRWEKEYHSNRLAEFQGNVDRAILNLIISFILINFILSYLIFIPVFRAVKKLSVVVQDIMAGNLSKRAEIKSKDEIGQLAASFNKMTDNLLEARRLPENILQSMKESLFVVDVNGNITEINQAAIGALGYEKEDLIGKPVSVVFAQGVVKGKEETKNKAAKYSPAMPPKEANTVASVGSAPFDMREMMERIGLGNLVAHGLAENIETNFKTKDGKTRPVNVTISALRDQEGSIQGMVITAKDLSELQKLQKEKLEITEKSKEEAERLVKERTAQLKQKIFELERFNKLAVGRELKMIELKKEIARLKNE